MIDNIATLFFILIGSHAIGDYALQTEYIAAGKTSSMYILFIHAAIWTFVITITWFMLGQTVTTNIVLWVLFIPHLLMDYTKAQSLWYARLIRDKDLQLAIDQLFHYVQLIILVSMANI